jgi:hypothetical protein
MIFKAISKTGYLGYAFLSPWTRQRPANSWLMQNLQNPDTIKTRIVPKWFFPPDSTNPKISAFLKKKTVNPLISAVLS